MRIRRKIQILLMRRRCYVDVIVNCRNCFRNVFFNHDELLTNNFEIFLYNCQQICKMSKKIVRDAQKRQIFEFINCVFRFFRNKIFMFAIVLIVRFDIVIFCFLNLNRVNSFSRRFKNDDNMSNSFFQIAMRFNMM